MYRTVSAHFQESVILAHHREASSSANGPIASVSMLGISIIESCMIIAPTSVFVEARVIPAEVTSARVRVRANVVS